MHSTTFQTGGKSTAGIGSNHVNPGWVNRSHSFFTQDENDPANMHASFDARAVKCSDSAPHIQYRDDWGNIYWFGPNSTYSQSGETVYTTEGGVGFIGVMKENTSTGLIEMWLPDGRKRRFNASGWLTQDVDYNGNTVTYTRDAQNFVTQIQLPEDDPSGSRTITVTYSVYRTSGGYDHKRLTQITYPNGVNYNYSYSGTTPPFYLTRILIKDINNNTLDDIDYAFASLSGKTLYNWYGSHLNTNTSYRITNIKDRNDEIITQFGYDDGYNGSTNWNYGNEVKKIGDKDGWVFQSPSHDWYDNEYPTYGFAKTTNNGTLVHKSSVSALYDQYQYQTQLDYTTTNTSVTDDSGTSYNVFTSKYMNTGGIDSKYVSETIDYAKYNYGSRNELQNIRNTYEFHKDQSGYGTTTQAYLNSSNLVKHNFYHHSGNYTVEYQYDLTKWFSPLKKVIIDSSGLNIDYEYTTDANGNLDIYKDPFDYQWDHNINSKGQLTSVTSPMSRTTTLQYTNYGDLWKVTDPGSRITEMNYSTSTSDLLWIKTPLGYYTRFEYDPLGRLTYVRDHSSNTLMQIAYNDAQHKVTVTDGESTSTEYQYNTSTKQLARRENLDGTTYTTTFTLNNEKTLSHITFADVTNATFAYDQMLRPKQVTVTNGSTSSSVGVKRDSMGNPREVVATLEDGSSQSTKYYYNSDVSLDYLEEPDGKRLDVGYDKLLRPTSLTKTTGSSQTMSQSYSYNSASQLTGTQLSTYATVSYGYNKDGQIRLVKRNNYTVTVYTYATDGRLSGIAHMTDPSGNTAYTTSTDAVSNNSDDRNITVLGYTYNNDNEITARSRGIYSPPGTLVRTVSMSAGYDSMGRVTSETYNGGGSYSLSRTNVYDKANNRTSKTEGGVTSTFNIFPGNRLQYISRTGVSNQRYTYNTRGQLTASWTDTDSDGVMDSNENRKVYTWTYTGLLKQANVYTNSGGTLTTVNYTYDESGTGMLRERSVVSGTAIRFHWEGLNIYLEEEKSGSTWYPKRAFVNQPSGLGGTMARFDLGANYQLDTSDSGYFYYYDEAGNVILIVDKTGAVTDQFEQDCWGNDLNNTFSSARAIKQHQTNKYLDETTGLYFFGARWYDPTISRFISVSPLAPMSEEEYVYCGDNPVNKIDNNGLWNIWNPATWGEPNAAGWGLGDSLNPFHPSSGYHPDTIGESTRKGLGAFGDGFIPFFDPFKSTYADDCGNIDSMYKWSQFFGSFSRDTIISIFIPNITNWIKNPAMYEMGQLTVADDVYNAIAHLDPIDKGRYLVNYYGGYINTIGNINWTKLPATTLSGPTPGGWLGLMGLAEGAGYFVD